MRCPSSTPAMVTSALANDLKPFIDAHRRLIARWSCSMMLFRYFELRTLTRRKAGCSRRKSRNARWLCTWPSSVTLRGSRSGCEASALRKNACAAAMPRSGRSMKSMLRPYHGSVQIVPFALDRDVRLVNAPGTTDRAGKSIPALLKFRDILNHPSHDHRVRNADATLGRYRNEISIAQAIADVPAHAQNNDLSVELALYIDRVTVLAFGHRASPSATQSSRRPLLHRNLQCSPGWLAWEWFRITPCVSGTYFAHRISTLQAKPGGVARPGALATRADWPAAAAMFTQLLPFYDARVVDLYGAFERGLYAGLAST